MADRRYAVAFDGELIEGVTGVDVRARLARIWPALPPSRIDALMGSRHATLKLFAEREVADRFVGFMRQAGMVCWLRLLRPGEEGEAAHLADLDWSATDSEALLAASSAPAPTPARRAVGPRAALGPKAMTAGILALLVGAGALYFAIENAPKKRRMVVPNAPAPVELTAAAEGTPVAPSAAAVVVAAPSQTLLVPEPVFVAARSERAVAKSAPPQIAEAAKLEGAMPKSETPRPAAPPVVVAPAAPAVTQVAVNRPVVPTAAPKAAEVIIAPTYDPAKVAQPRYPVQAFRNHEQGQVLLDVLVGADGKVKKVSVGHTSGSGALDRAAVEAVKGWQFTPGTRNGVAQDAARRVEVAFRLEE